MEKSITLNEMFNNLKHKNEQSKEIIETSAKVVELINHLVEKRKTLGLSQRELANKIGMKQPALARIESLIVVPKISTLISIANALCEDILSVDKDYKIS